MRALLVAAAALIALAPVANATTPQDDQYLALLKDRNIGGNPDKLIGYGLSACDNYGTPELAVAQIEHMQAIGYTETQTKTIIGTGLQAYCPDKLHAKPPQGAPPGAATPQGAPPQGAPASDVPPEGAPPELVPPPDAPPPDAPPPGAPLLPPDPAA
ncbi:MAG TPA: DUF732 domain-containing protein [Mycobacterium sp.]